MQAAGYRGNSAPAERGSPPGQLGPEPARVRSWIRQNLGVVQPLRQAPPGPAGGNAGAAARQANAGTKLEKDPLAAAPDSDRPHSVSPPFPWQLDSELPTVRRRALSY